MHIHLHTFVNICPYATNINLETNILYCITPDVNQTSFIYLLTMLQLNEKERCTSREVQIVHQTLLYQCLEAQSYFVYARDTSYKILRLVKGHPQRPGGHLSVWVYAYDIRNTLFSSPCIITRAGGFDPTEQCQVSARSLWKGEQRIGDPQLDFLPVRFRVNKVPVNAKLLFN